MTIDPLITSTAKYFSLDASLIQAVMIAEGGTLAALLRAVRCSVPKAADEAEAVRITSRTVLHRAYDFHYKAGSGTPEQFIAYLGASWAPVGAANDPHGLNKNWVANVSKIWLGK